MSLPVPCMEPGCRGVTRQGSRCEAHKRSRWSTSASDYDWYWRHYLRPQVMREEPTCRACGRPTEIIDHRVNKARARELGWTEDQTNARSNLQGLCRRCSNAKTASEGHQARRRANREGDGVATGSGVTITPPDGDLTASRFREIVPGGRDGP